MYSVYKAFSWFPIALCLGFLPACGQRSSAEPGLTGSPSGSEGTSSSASQDPFASLGNAKAGSTASSAAADLQKMAQDMDNLSGSASGPSQAGLLKELSQWAKSAQANYQGLKPGVSFAAVAAWANRQKSEREKLLAMAQKARQAELDTIAEAIEDLANRRDVFVAAKTMKNGGFRFAYFRDANFAASYLEGYAFRAVAFQVYEKPQRIASDTADVKLFSCAHSATEEGRQAWVFYAATGGCGANTALPEMGYISARPTSRTTRDLFLTVRLVDNESKPNSDFTDTFMIPGRPALDAYASALSQYHYQYSETPIGYVN